MKESRNFSYGDKRHTLFVSSRMDELREDRATAQRGILSLEARPLMFEFEPPWNILKKELDKMLSLCDGFVGLYHVTAGNRGPNIHMLTPIEYELYYFVTDWFVQRTGRFSKSDERKELNEIWKIIGVDQESSPSDRLLPPEERAHIHGWRRAIASALTWYEKSRSNDLDMLKESVHLYRRRSATEWTESFRLRQLLEPWDRLGFLTTYDTQPELFHLVVRDLSPLCPKHRHRGRVGDRKLKLWSFTVGEPPDIPGVVWAASDLAWRHGANVVALHSIPGNREARIRFIVEPNASRISDKKFFERMSEMSKKLGATAAKVAEQIGRVKTPGKELTQEKLRKKIEEALGSLVVTEYPQTEEELGNRCQESLHDDLWQIREQSTQVLLVAYHRNVPGILQAMAQIIAMDRWSILKVVMFPKWSNGSLPRQMLENLHYVRDDSVQTTFMVLEWLEAVGNDLDRDAKVLEFDLVDLIGVEWVSVFVRRQSAERQ